MQFVNSYFWRTYEQKEIDYIEEKGGKYFAFEFKYNPQKVQVIPKEFRNNYPQSEYSVITPENFWNFVI